LIDKPTGIVPNLYSNLKMTVATKPKMRWRNFWVCFSISLGQLAFGYPASIIGTTLGQPAFLLYMGLITPEGELGNNANNLIGATSGVFQVIRGIVIIRRY